MYTMLKGVLVKNLQGAIFYCIYGLNLFIIGEKKYFISYLKKTFFFRISYFLFFLILIPNSFLKKNNSTLTSISMSFKGHNIASTYVKAIQTINVKMISVWLDVYFILLVLLNLFFWLAIV